MRSVGGLILFPGTWGAPNVCFCRRVTVEEEAPGEATSVRAPSRRAEWSRRIGVECEEGVRWLSGERPPRTARLPAMGAAESTLNRGNGPAKRSVSAVCRSFRVLAYPAFCLSLLSFPLPVHIVSVLILF